MKAVTNHRYGSSDVMKLEDVPTPRPAEGEVLIKVRAASVNSWDYDKLTGEWFVIRMEGPLRPQHTILGCDVAGTVEAVGAGVTRLMPGDEVFGDISGCGWGAFAEHVCAREDLLAEKPPGMSFETAASLPQAGVLALQGLRMGEPFRPGYRLLVNGGGGGVGTLAIQMAKARGAEVTGVDNTHKLEVMRELGADYVYDYRQTDYTRTGRRYDLIIDNVARRSILDYRRALRRGGTFGAVGGRMSTILSTLVFGHVVSLTRGTTYGPVMHTPNRDDVGRVAELVTSGTVKPVIDGVYPLRETPEAFRRFASGRFCGKIVIAVDGE
jgi:NADPH:quinone reductase-like Zn-dependent oxidoreductase